MTLAVIFGTRPDAIKLGPVVHELRQLGVAVDLVCTNQHTTLLSGTPADTDLAGAWDLDLPSTGDVWSWVEEATDRLADYLHDASAVLVQGDTMTALAGARAAKRLGLPLHHVEAGLRSHNLHAPWPEELIRVEIAQTATWHYAPTQTSRANLVLEGVPDDHIVVTGNSGVSALDRYRPQTFKYVPRKDTILVTMHRREARSASAVCIEAAFAWSQAHATAQIIWVTHPSQTRRAVTGVQKHHPRFQVALPLSYRDMAYELACCIGIATDSGGLQEEAATLGVPCAVLREVTDRPESIEAGVAKLFPPTPEGITDALETLWSRQIPRRQTDCFGDSDSAHRIALAVHRNAAKRAPVTLPRFLQPNPPELERAFATE